MTLTNQEKIAAWDLIAAKWEIYCTRGAGEFDWDFDSRPVMAELTGHHSFDYLRQALSDDDD